MSEPVSMHRPRTLTAPDFDLALSLQCGQVFHADLKDGIWSVVADRELFVLGQKADRLEIFRGAIPNIRRYFNLDHPMTSVYESFPSDAYSQAALAGCRGMRIIRQPLWECLATFITSSMKQVAHIRQMSLTLRSKYGQAVEGSSVNAYPEATRIASLSESDLRACGLGFRAKSLLGTAREISEGRVNLESLQILPTSELREALCCFPGVGRKIANCVLLFAYGRLEAVPVDVWIARIATAMRRRKASPLKLEEFSVRRFGPYAGYVQQYLFHHARTTGTLPGQ